MGQDVQKNYQEARHLVGIVPQELVFDPFFNVREMLRFQAGYFGKGRENAATTTSMGSPTISPVR